ncbi:radical SAM protein [Clostridium sp. HMP27]|uniref:radical SAM protein n=1 Tax=Clostridium sp. HMP27 TaxID=1487921 RepID=UPI00052BF9B1|nr:radical SAM protein [Clostridium sp. HMP27]KGK90785.1 radical SAM protein [Clostridium sp. HMP27]
MKVIKKLVSCDNSIKYLLRMKDGNTIETLYMYDKELKLTYHSTVCVSSQVGCTQGCFFCATGKQGLVRNLTSLEITEQVGVCVDYCKEAKLLPIDAVVFAGMGEPFMNYENVRDAIISIYNKYKISSFEIATVGLAPRIRRLINDFKDSDVKIRLNLSLHASSNDTRKNIMPVTLKYDINSIIEAAVEYAETFNIKTRIRYMIFKGINDTDEDVKRLEGLLADKPLKLIISAYNDNNIEGLIAPQESDVTNFYNKLKNKIDCEIFHNFGKDIKGGCGQLRQEKMIEDEEVV